MSLFIKLIISISAIFVVAVGTTCLVVIHNFEDIFLTLRESRLSIMMQDIQETLEVGLRIKESFSALRSFRPTLDKIKSSDPNISAIEVFDKTGLVRFGTDPSFDRDFISQSWQEKLKSGIYGPWHIDDRETGLYVVGLPLTNGREEVVGGVVVIYDQASIRRTIRSVADRLVWASLLAIGLAIAATAATVNLLIRPIRVTLAGMADQARYALTEAQRAAASGEGNSTANPLEQEFTRLLAKIEQAQVEIETTVLEIRAIDEQADQSDILGVKS